LYEAFEVKRYFTAFLTFFIPDHAVLRLTPRVRKSWFALMPFLLAVSNATACSQRCTLDVARFEHGSNGHAELLATLIALVNADPGALALHLGNAINPTAVRAHGAIRPNPRFQVLVSGGFVVEMRGG
jgi:hypothetical protein